MTIYEYLKEKSPSDIKQSNYKLPDIDIEKGERWVPGAFEGTVLRSTMKIKYHSMVNFFTARKVKKQALKPSAVNREKLLKRLEKYSAISIVDPICSFCVAFKFTKDEQKKKALRELALDLIMNVNKREIVKLGIALLGICGTQEDLELIKPIGMHDEFTLYVAGTASRLLEGKEKNFYLLELMRNVCGWGKIAILYELDYSDDEARYEVIKTGCKNDIDLSYSANVCAIKGKMLDVLKNFYKNIYEKEEELKIFSGICDIFTGLLGAKDNHDGLSEYPDARETAKLFTQICQSKPYLEEYDERSKNICQKVQFIL